MQNRPLVSRLGSLKYIKQLVFGSRVSYTRYNIRSKQLETLVRENEYDVYTYNTEKTPKIYEEFNQAHVEKYKSHQFTTYSSVHYAYSISDKSLLSCDQFSKAITEKTILEKSDDKNKQNILHYLLKYSHLMPSPEHIEYEQTWIPKDYLDLATFKNHLESVSLPTLKFNVEYVYKHIHDEVIKPALTKIPAPRVLEALTAQDNEGNTPLHVGILNIQYPYIFSRVQAVLQKLRALNLSEAEKQSLLNFYNSNGETITDCLAKNIHLEVLKEMELTFGRELIQEKIKKSSSFLPNLASKPVKYITDTLNHFDTKSESISSPSYFTTDDQGRNFLHLICRKAKEKTEEESTTELIERVCTRLGKDTDALLLTVTNNEWNAMHYACRSGNNDNIACLVSSASPETIYNAITVKNKQGFTAVDYACKYGNKEILTILFDKINELYPGAAYQLVKINEKKLRSYVTENPKLTMAEFENQYDIRMDPALKNLIDAHNYLEMRRKEFEHSYDYSDRKENFLKQLDQMIKPSTGATFRFSADQQFMNKSCCFFNFGTQRYFNIMNQLEKYSTNLNTLIKFKQFLLTQGSSKISKEILEKLETISDNVSVTTVALDSDNRGNKYPSAPPLQALPPPYSATGDAGAGSLSPPRYR